MSSDENLDINSFDDDKYEDRETENTNDKSGKIRNVTFLSQMYKEWFLDYASYVILERAVPYVNDGLKPVQRRILHAMKKLDDGRYNKVANIIGNTMQYHPHGDASIGDALVNLGQKDLLIDTQGNWGNIYTGDRAAAPRYIEARLSKFALAVLFNAKTTNWKQSYDGRNKEPVTLPAKFPLLLNQGVEGIAVGLASKILPHNFVELIYASIDHLKGKSFVLYPDFPTKGMIDVSRYNDGLRGGAVKVRAKIEKVDNKTLCIRELPYGKTTTSLIESILKANEKAKIKIKKIDDNTAAEVEIIIHLATGISSDKTIDALYAFTDCEISISPNACIIEDEKPHFIGVSEILRKTSESTVALLKLELEIRKQELEDSWHYASLERIFIENRIYLAIEECESWEAVIAAIDLGLKPFVSHLKRDIVEDDIIRLTEIKIKRISKYDMDKARNYIKSIEDEIAQIVIHINNIVNFTIDYYKDILSRFGKGRERQTEIRSFENIVATKVVVANEKLYVNRAEGFVGTGLKKDEFICDCSDIDDIIVFRRDGTYFITRVSDKSFIGKNPLHVAIFLKNDKRTTYNVAYRDGKLGVNYVKRFNVTSMTRDKEYAVTKGTTGSKVLYFSANSNGEAEVVRITLKPRPRIKKQIFLYDISLLAIKGRASMGNVLSKNEILKVSMKSEGVSTLGGRKIWFDTDVQRLNNEKRGTYLGEFNGSDKILVVNKKGEFYHTNFDLGNHYEDGILIIEKFDEDKIWTAIFYDADQSYYYIKRFAMESVSKTVSFIGENSKNKLICLSDFSNPKFNVSFKGKHKSKPEEEIDAVEFIGEKSYKARGKRLSILDIKTIVELKEEVVLDEKKMLTEEGDNKDQEDLKF